MTNARIIALLLLSTAFAAACSRSDSGGDMSASSGYGGKQGKKKTRERVGLMATRPDMDVAATGCDSTLWSHVYKPERLAVIAQCTVATGVIADPRPDDDGDMHANLMLDPGQDALVNKRNAKKKNGGLVIEIVCAVPAKSPKAAITTCSTYHATLQMPAAGAHVRVLGTHVNDTHNGWLEIHPVSRIDAVK